PLVISYFLFQVFSAQIGHDEERFLVLTLFLRIFRILEFSDINDLDDPLKLN
ncbi:hypothetical protein SMU44_09064, partial [Streptococcus mutans 11VS1]